MNEQFNFTKDVNSNSISDQKMISGSEANKDYHHLSSQDKTDILFVFLGILGLACWIVPVWFVCFGE